MNKWQLSVEDLAAVATLNFKEFMLDWKTIKDLDGSRERLLVEDCQNLDFQDPDQQQLNLNQNQIQHQTVSIYFVPNHLSEIC